jgi:hypothetical protein
MPEILTCTVSGHPSEASPTSYAVGTNSPPITSRFVDSRTLTKITVFVNLSAMVQAAPTSPGGVLRENPAEDSGICPMRNIQGSAPLDSEKGV